MLKYLVFIIIIFSIDTIDAQSIKIQIHERNYLNFNFLECKRVPNPHLIHNPNSFSFVKYTGQKFPSKIQSSNRMITLRSQFQMDTTNKNNELVLVCPPIFYACNIYLNGIRIGSRGGIDSIYANRIHITEEYHLPIELIHCGTLQQNEIALELFSFFGEKSPIEPIFIANRAIAESYVFWRNFFCSDFLKAMSLISIVIGLYFFIFYFIRKQERTSYYLPFSLACFSYCLAYINYSITYSSEFSFNLEKLGFVGAILWACFAPYYLMDYSQVFKKIKPIMLVVFLINIPGMLKILNASNVEELSQVYVHYLSPIFIITGSLNMLVSFLFFKRTKSKQSKIILFLCLISIPSFFYDEFYFAFEKTQPYLYTLPFIMFLSIVGFFFIVAWEQSEIYKSLIFKTMQVNQLNENLELKVSERTKELKILNETKDKFFNIIAHDLRNPFYNILGYSELLSKNITEYENQKAVDFAQTIQRSAKNAHQLLENLLDWSMSQTGQLEFKPESFDLKKMVLETKEVIDGMLLSKNIELIDQIPEQTMVQADHNMIAMVLRNLLTNALKYTPQNGQVVITCKTNEQQVEICVQDNGVGFSTAQIEYLFQINKKTQTAGTDNEKGTGLGLLLCKEFINKHKGEIWVENVEEGGSRIIFTLPYKK